MPRGDAFQTIGPPLRRCLFAMDQTVHCVSPAGEGAGEQKFGLDGVSPHHAESAGRVNWGWGLAKQPLRPALHGGVVWNFDGRDNEMSKFSPKQCLAAPAQSRLAWKFCRLASKHCRLAWKFQRKTWKFYGVAWKFHPETGGQNPELGSSSAKFGSFIA